MNDRLAISDKPSLAVRIDGEKAAHFMCTFALQRLALRTSAWFPVVTSQLAGNAVTLIMPGGAAVGAAVQFRMLAISGSDAGAAVGALASYSLFGVGGPAGPASLRAARHPAGSSRRPKPGQHRLLGAAGFVVFAALGAVVMAYDAPLRWVGGAVQRVANLLLRNRPPLTGFSESLLAQRDEIRAVLGRQWWQALLLSAGRLAFDYLCLLASLRATGCRPWPSLILVAYAVSGIVGMIPLTPGGLGLVEASLSGLLVLAQVDSSQAVLATLGYRLASYWAPLCAGPIAYALFRIRYRGRPSAPRTGAARDATSMIGVRPWPAVAVSIVRVRRRERGSPTGMGSGSPRRSAAVVSRRRRWQPKS